MGASPSFVCYDTRASGRLEEFATVRQFNVWRATHGFIAIAFELIFELVMLKIEIEN